MHNLLRVGGASLLHVQIVGVACWACTLCVARGAILLAYAGVLS